MSKGSRGFMEVDKVPDRPTRKIENVTWLQESEHEKDQDEKEEEIYQRLLKKVQPHHPLQEVQLR